VKTNDSIVAVAAGAIVRKVGWIRVHPAQASGRDEHVRQTDIIQDDKIMTDRAELDVDEA
jgi:hypothetical protein